MTTGRGLLVALPHRTLVQPSAMTLTILANPYLLWLAVINLVTLVAFALDKRAAQTGRWRTRNITLLVMIAAGGVIGGYVGMTRLRHKSQQWYYHTVLWLAVLVHGLLAWWALGASQ